MVGTNTIIPPLFNADGLVDYFKQHLPQEWRRKDEKSEDAKRQLAQLNIQSKKKAKFSVIKEIKSLS